MATEISIDQRRDHVAELLGVQGFMSLAELVEELDVSESTIRRDLEVLEEKGLIRRTHGGAVWVKDAGAHSYAFDERSTAAATEKQSIAAAVAELIPTQQTVLLDGGTTCYQVARALLGRRLSVITNSVPIASLLAGDVNTEVTLLGGYLYPRAGVALGAFAEQMLGQLHATQLVVSCAGLSPEGAFNINEMMAAVERRMMDAADEVILAADHTKLDRRSVVQLCSLDRLDVVVTDAAVNDETRAWLGEADVRVIYAE